ncbi:MAG: nuclear transport factor 2 family protein [Solirubrobacterales bacterium]
MSEQDVAVIREQFEAVNDRKFEHAMAIYSDDVVLVVPGSGVKAGRFEGKEAVGEWFGDWFRAFAPDYRFEITEANALDSGTILLVARHWGKGRMSGAQVEDENGYLYRVRDGKVSQVGFFETREEAIEAAALPEWSEAKTD